MAKTKIFSWIVMAKTKFNLFLVRMLLLTCIILIMHHPQHVNEGGDEVKPQLFVMIKFAHKTLTFVPL